MADNERTYRIIFEADSLDDARQKAAALDSQIDQIAGSYRQAAAGQDIAVSRMDRNLEGHYEKIALQTRLLRVQTDQTKGELDKQIALIEERYAFEIAQAKGNARIIKELEQQKTLQIELANQRQQARSSGAAAPIGRLSGALGGFAALTAAAFAVQPVVNFGKAAISTAAEFETLKTRLDNMYGSVQAGNRAFDNFNKVAATTPFALAEVVSAGATLKAFGIDAEQRIKIVADLAAFMGRTVEDAASALGRAFAGGAGAADVFRETGILNLIKSKQGIDDLTKLTLPQFREAMFKTFSDPSSGIAGATDKLSKTITGLESNLGDAFDRMLANVGNRFAPGYKSTLSGLISITESLGESFASTVDRAKQFETLRIDTGATISQLQGLTKTISGLGDPARLSAAEQEKLNATYQEIARIVPGAVTEVDKYGNALSVNLNVVNAFIDSQQRLISTTQRITLNELRGDLKSTADAVIELQTNIERTQGRIEALSLAKIQGQRQQAERLAGEFGIDILPTDPAAINRFLDRQFKALDRLKPELVEAQRVLDDLSGSFIQAYSEGDKINVEKIQRGMTLSKESFDAVRPSIDAYIRSLSNATEFGQAFDLDNLRQQLNLSESDFSELVKTIEGSKGSLKLAKIEFPAIPQPEFGNIELPDFNLQSFRDEIDATSQDYRGLVQLIGEGKGALKLPPINIGEFDLQAIRDQFNLTEVQVSSLIPALKAYQEQLNKGQAKQVDANTKKQLEALQLQRRTLELQTNIALGEYEKQKAVVSERYAAEIRQAGGNVQVIREFEAIKALEIEKINQKILSDATKRDAAIAAEGVAAFQRFKAELDKDTEKKLLTFDPVEIPPPPPPDPATLKYYDDLQARIEKVGDVFKNSILKQWREGGGIMRAFGETAKDVLEEIAATIIKNAAIYAIANILTGGSAGGLTGGLSAGQFIFGNAFGGGGSNLTFSGGGSSSLNFSPPPQQNTPQAPGNTYNITIQAQDAVSFEQFLRERDGAKVIARTLTEVV